MPGTIVVVNQLICLTTHALIILEVHTHTHTHTRARRVIFFFYLLLLSFTHQQVDTKQSRYIHIVTLSHNNNTHTHTHTHTVHNSSEHLPSFSQPRNRLGSLSNMWTSMPNSLESSDDKVYYTTHIHPPMCGHCGTCITYITSDRYVCGYKARGPRC